MPRAALHLAIACLSSACAASAGGSADSGPLPRSARSDVTGGVIATTGGRTSSAEISIAATPSAAWPALVKVYQGLGLPLNVDEASRTIGVRRARVRRILDAKPSTYFDCGQAAMGTVADIYTVEMDLTSRLVDAGGGRTSLQTSVAARATSPTGSPVPIGCSSTGSLESRLSALLQGELGLQP